MLVQAELAHVVAYKICETWSYRLFEDILTGGDGKHWEGYADYKRVCDYVRVLKYQKKREEHANGTPIR